MNSLMCRHAIVEKLRTNDGKESFLNQFVRNTPEEIADSNLLYEEALLVRNWKLTGKHTNKLRGKVERTFDLMTADDQVRAYVTTDSTDTNVVRLYILGE